MVDSQLEDFILCRATPQQWRRIHENEVKQWAEGLSVDNFVERETQLCFKSPLSQQGEYTPWILVPGNDTATLDFACSCETYRRPMLIKDAGHPDGAEEPLLSIASVFTPERNRGKGYASRMMVLLHDKLAEQSPISVLYSDIGDFYSKVKRIHEDVNRSSGWEITGASKVIWNVDSDTVSEPMPSYSSTLGGSDFESACRRAADSARKAVREALGPAFAVIPTKDQLDWQILRCKLYHSLRDLPCTIDTWGCQLGNSDDPNWAFLVWSYDVKEEELTILLIHAHTPQQLQDMLRVAQHAAVKQGMKIITAWNVPEHLLEGTGWQNVQMKDHLPAMAWYGEGEKPQWLRNERFCWC